MDKDLLLYYMKKAGKTRTDVAEAVGMSERTLQNKVLGHTEFTHREITKLADVLSLSGGDLLSIFFSNIVE